MLFRSWDTTTDTILVFVGLVLCGWLYIAVPSFTISVRRLHDDGKPVFWAVLPQVAIFYLLAEFTLGLPPNWIVWGILGAITAVSFGFMSLPGIPLDDAYGEEPRED